MLGADPALSSALAALGAEVTAIRPNERDVSGVNLRTFVAADTSKQRVRTGLRTTLRNPLLPTWTRPDESPPSVPSVALLKPKLAIRELLASPTRMRFRTSEDATYRMPTELAEATQQRVYELEPEQGAEANHDAVKAIGHAQVIVLGPGPFFSSVLATLAAPSIAAALVRSRAPILFFANRLSEGVMTEGMALPCYARLLREHVQRWAGSALRHLTVVAHGERATWSAIDAQTRLRRVPLQTGNEQRWLALAEATDLIAGLVSKRVSVPIEPGVIYEPAKLLGRR